MYCYYELYWYKYNIHALCKLCICIIYYYCMVISIYCCCHSYYWLLLFSLIICNNYLIVYVAIIIFYYNWLYIVISNDMISITDSIIPWFDNFYITPFKMGSSCACPSTQIPITPRQPPPQHMSPPSTRRSHKFVDINPVDTDSHNNCNIIKLTRQITDYLNQY